MLLQDLLFPAVVVLGFYLLLVRPARARAKAAAQVRASLAAGAQVLTTAGMHATVLEAEDERGTVLLEIAPGVPVRFAAAAVVRVLEPVDQPLVEDDGS